MVRSRPELRKKVVSRPRRLPFLRGTGGAVHSWRAAYSRLAVWAGRGWVRGSTRARIRRGLCDSLMVDPTSRVALWGEGVPRGNSRPASDGRARRRSTGSASCTAWEHRLGLHGLVPLPPLDAASRARSLVVGNWATLEHRIDRLPKVRPGERAVSSRSAVVELPSVHEPTVLVEEEEVGCARGVVRL